MDKNLFLETLNERIKNSENNYEKYYAEPELDIDTLKKRMISLIQTDFIESVPEKIKQGTRFKLSSRNFKVVRGLGTDCYITIEGKKIKLKIWKKTWSLSDGWYTLKELEKQICKEMSKDISKKVYSNIENDKLYFYCYY